MGTKPKTRFMVEANGALLELFSVRVSTNGDLRILPKSPKFAIFGDNHREIVEQHLSVHNANGGRDTCITLPQQFNDGGTVDYATFLENTSDNLLWPLICRRVGIVARKTGEPRSKDGVLKLPSYQTAKATLFFTAYVHAPAVGLAEAFGDAVSTVTAPCGRFMITVTANFLNIPTLENGHLFGAVTSTPTDRGQRMPNHVQIERASMTLGEALGYHWMGLTFLREQMLSVVWPIMANEPQDRLDFFANLASVFTAVPMIQSPEV